MTKIGLATELL